MVLPKTRKKNKPREEAEGMRPRLLPSLIELPPGVAPLAERIRGRAHPPRPVHRRQERRMRMMSTMASRTSHQAQSIHPRKVRPHVLILGLAEMRITLVVAREEGSLLRGSKGPAALQVPGSCTTDQHGMPPSARASVRPRSNKHEPAEERRGRKGTYFLSASAWR